MRIHWYWPFARPEELSWAEYTAGDDHIITVQVIDRDAAPASGGTGKVIVRRDLPDVERRRERGVRWALSRATTYRQRARERRRAWDREAFDLVHLQYVNRFTDAFTDPHVPWVISVHDVVPHRQRLGRMAERFLLHRLYERPDALVVHHRLLADELVKRFGIVTGRIHVVPHQVFPVAGPVGPPPADEPPLILFFGALRRNKGLDVLDAALAQISGRELRVLIAGRGDPALEEEAREMARRDPRVRYEVDYVTLDRKAALFQEASVVVLPYTSFASQSGVLHDAYGHHRPVVVSDVGALGNTVTEDETGLVVPPGDPHALARAIERALDPQGWKRWSEAAGRIAERRSPAAAGEALREVYRQVVR